MRKARIEANRAAKMRPEKVDEGAARRAKKVEPEQKDAGRAKAQITESRKRIDTAKQTTTENVTNVPVAITYREYQRRAEEARRAENWERKRAEEAQKSAAAAEDIDKGWSAPGVDPAMGIVSGRAMYELNELLAKQKQACDALSGTKNKLIAEYVAELKSKDDEYVKELKRQAEEIDTLLERMEQQHRSFQTTLREEIDAIEKAFVEERTDLVDSTVGEVDQLFETRRANESRYMEERAERIEEHIKQLEALRVHDAEEYNLVKIKLETDVQVLEQQLQQMRATYQLNTEKLEYNYSVLKKREEENGTILGAQKRKITRLTDHLNTLKAKIAKQEKGFQQEYMALTDDYKRITEQFKELQKKFRHFQVADSKKYRDVWKMNDELAKELMRKVVQADRIIHEQQLGIPYIPPAEELFRSVDPGFFHGGGGGRSISPSSVAASPDLEEGAAAAGGKAAEPELERRDSLAAKFRDHRGNNKTMKRVMELLCNEAGFLVEDKLQKLLAPLHRDEQSLMKLDSIFKALGVESVEDIEKLATYFIAREPKEKDQGKKKEDEKDKEKETVDIPTTTPNILSLPSLSTPPTDSPNQQPETDTTQPQPTTDDASSDVHSDSESETSHAAMTRFPDSDEEGVKLIHPNEVMRSIRRFMEVHRREKIAGGAGSSGNFGDVVGREGEDVEGGGEFEETATPLPAEDVASEDTNEAKSVALRQYWESMANVIDEKQYRVWTAVHTSMEKYNSLLSERHSLASEVDSIARQNEELKSLLRQYMSARVNEELQVPPTQILLAQAGLLQPGTAGGGGQVVGSAGRMM
ncbi:hypothetical protein HDV00_008155 [Rhizophlyctis rosea]|nr:hypothetical protein HDV00_008155 [Rhizophlyctis rosea]